MLGNKKQIKEEGGLPDLPELNSNMSPLESYPNRDNYPQQDIHELPSFPDSPMQKGFSQTAIKDAVANEKVEDYNSDLPEFEETLPLPNNHDEDSTRGYNLNEMDEWTPSQTKNSPPSMEFPKKLSNVKAVYVKIDKFREARESLDKISGSLVEIEDLLKQVRDVKAKEDRELSSWEKDLENIKTRINSINTNIFERAEV